MQLGQNADSERSCYICGRGEEENSTDMKRDRERIIGGRSLREVFGTGLGVLRDERSVAPAITVC